MDNIKEERYKCIMKRYKCDSSFTVGAQFYKTCENTGEMIKIPAKEIFKDFDDAIDVVEFDMKVRSKYFE